MDSVLIVGSGGREHAIQKALLRTDRPLCMYAYPGNPGLAHDGCMLLEKTLDGWAELAQWALENEIDLTIVGPEIPLVEGIVDVFEEKGLTIFGPNSKAARIEGSKQFSKELMKNYDIPTAAFEVFTDKKSALDYLESHGAPIVVKASGLAAGKGAIVCNSKEEAVSALTDMFDKRIFGDAANSVVLEEMMTGEEASIFVLTDGKDYKLLPISQDHKPIGEGDTGPNTGGMGAYAPAPLVDDALLHRVEKNIIAPTLDAMRKEGAAYKGLLYVGIMVADDGPKVVEYNCRFGDPETQAVLPLVNCDLYDVFYRCATGKLGDARWEVLPKSCATVVCASKGYPGPYEKGKQISGIDKAEYNKPNVDVYHAGTRLVGDDTFVTNGGRVLSVSAWDDTLEGALSAAYDAVDQIQFEGKTCRNDIGAKGVARIKK
ncbi:MAG: phosphoribosylamine--glycine ligase [Chitinivibrionales bacterium]|nr:phosphoribosylamine--glycine ligase [Chitinivibrionales bacterium]